MAVLTLLLSATISAAPVEATPPDPVRPAMWMVRDGDTTIYLFGTFHILDGTTDWFKGDVKDAFQSADQLVLETLLPKPPKAALSGNVTATVGPKPRRVAPATPVPPGAQLTRSASFLASTQLVMSASRARGMSSALGADAELREAAEDSGKPVGALESFEYQINMFSSLQAQPASAKQPRQAPQQVQAQDPKTVRTLSIMLAQLQDAWNRGDLDSFDPMLEQMRVQSPEAYSAIFVKRNTRWAHWISDRLQRPGTVFVAVGAGHLTGPDSVQNQLASIGLSSARIN